MLAVVANPCRGCIRPRKKLQEPRLQWFAPVSRALPWLNRHCTGRSTTQIRSSASVADPLFLTISRSQPTASTTGCSGGRLLTRSMRNITLLRFLPSLKRLFVMAITSVEAVI